MSMNGNFFRKGIKLFSFVVPLMICFGVGGCGFFLDSATRDENQRARDIEIDLKPQSEDVSIEGSARVIPESDNVRVILNLGNIQPRETYAAMIHKGNCSEVGEMEVHLNSVTSSGGSRATSTTDVSYKQIQSDESKLIMVHKPNHQFALCNAFPSIRELKE